MRPTATRRKELRIDPAVLGRPQIWTVQYEGLLHTSEVVIAESVRPKRECRLGLTPEEATLLLIDNRQAMCELPLCLGSHAVRRVLAHSTKAQLYKLLKLVQAADVSKLPNVLDDEVVDLQRRFLRRG